MNLMKKTVSCIALDEMNETNEMNEMNEIEWMESTKLEWMKAMKQFYRLAKTTNRMMKNLHEKA